MLKGATTFSMTTLSNVDLIGTPSASVIMLVLKCSVLRTNFYCFAECRHVKRRYADCRGAYYVEMNVPMHKCQFNSHVEV
jgi:hypothetical protein